MALTLVACAGAPVPAAVAVAPTPPPAIDRAQCANEPVLLEADADVLSAPAVGAGVLARLRAGNVLYLCSTAGDWTAVMLPAAGERVDCSRRSGNTAPCPVGWVRQPLRYAVIG